jgi:hypothetical protein
MKKLLLTTVILKQPSILTTVVEKEIINTITTAYLYAVTNFQIHSITHTSLVVGHTALGYTDNLVFLEMLQSVHEIPVYNR